MRLTQEQAKALFEISRQRASKCLAPAPVRPAYNPAEMYLKRVVLQIAVTKGLDAVEEYRPLETRRFRVDAAIPDLKVAFECDGWQYHAKHKDAWLNEKARDRLFLRYGWHVYRFAASEILNGLAEKEIEQIVEIEIVRCDVFD